MLNYRQLHQFWHVARAGSVRRAAEQLHLTPQTLSGQIGEFESRWGVQLFERQGRQLVLTEMGRQLLERADAEVGPDEDHARIALGQFIHGVETGLTHGHLRAGARR